MTIQTRIIASTSDRGVDALNNTKDPAFDFIVQRAARMFSAPIALISILDDRRQWFKAKVGLMPDETPLAMSFCTHAVQRDGLFKVDDTHLDARFVNNPLVTGQPGIRFYAGLPLRLPNGMRRGTLCVIDQKPRFDFGDNHSRQLSALVDDTVRLMEQRKIEAQRLDR